MKAGRGRSQRLELTLEDGRGVEVASQLAVERGLRPGTELGERELEELRRADAQWRARESAYALLAHRSRSEAELRERLARKGFDADVIDLCVAELDERGYIDDDAFAMSFARDRVRLRPRGARAIELELRAKGVAAATARLAVERACAAEGLDEGELALRAATAWAKRSLGDDAAVTGRDARLRLRRRLYGHLARRGFGGDALRAAMDAVLP